MLVTSPSSRVAHKVLILDAIEEAEFTASHPQVISVTEDFHSRSSLSNTFQAVNMAASTHPQRGALVVASSWLQFTELVPKLLCTLAANAEDNLARHFLIQTAFEELGGRSKSAIHCELFAQSLDACDVGRSPATQFSRSEGKLTALRLLDQAKDLRENARIMGLCLGLELPANENIQTLINCIGADELHRANLKKTAFFQIHTVVEDEHIRLSVANYLRFCRSPEAQQIFQSGFDMGTAFWKAFWRETVEML